MKRKRTGIVCFFTAVLIHVLVVLLDKFYHIANITRNAVETRRTHSTKIIKRTNKTCVRSLQWAVTTTIFDVNDAIRTFATNFPDICLVVVGDLKTNDTVWIEFEQAHSDSVLYISASEQKTMSARFQTVKLLPWNHFSRKNIGYLLALANNAQFLFDFDDDNHLRVESTSRSLDNVIAKMTVHSLESNNHHILNPYPYFQPVVNRQSKSPLQEEAFIWPRGQSLQFISDPNTTRYKLQNDDETRTTTVNLQSIAVIQSLADHNPDVDAIYRMTRKLPVDFRKPDTLLVMPPHGLFVPWNSQAVFVRQPALFGLLLPMTVMGRVSDIWRSYITERLLWETSYRIGFCSSLVTQYRNPHSYIQDFRDELDLYTNVDKLLLLLAQWTSDGYHTLSDAYLGIVMLLVQNDILGPADAELAKAWVADLATLNYTWPSITNRRAPFVPKTPEVVDEREMLLMNNYLANTKDLTGKSGSSTARYYTGMSLREGVLPVRRFRIRPGTGRELETRASSQYAIESNGDLYDGLTACNDACLEAIDCDGWEWHGGGGDNNLEQSPSCSLFSNIALAPLRNSSAAPNNTLDAIQADSNDPNYVVGFVQRRSHAMRLSHRGVARAPSANAADISNRTLFVMHSHHPIQADLLDTVLNKIFVGYLPSSSVDLVVISPLEQMLISGSGEELGSTLINPFAPKPGGKRGSNSHLSMPIVRAKFPGYSGYLLFNDDSALRTWDLFHDKKLWFGARPWVTFLVRQPGEVAKSVEQRPRTIRPRYPHGPYGDWAWWNLDSGTTDRPPKGLTRSNFDAALAAVNEFCSITRLKDMTSQASRRTEFCDQRSNITLTPYAHGKGDVFYTPGTTLGHHLSSVLTLMGEHDVMLEIAVPIAYGLVVPDDMQLTVPYCDGDEYLTRNGQLRRHEPGHNLTFSPYYHVPGGTKLTCPVIHPLKFSRKDSVEYWEKVVREECRDGCLGVGSDKMVWKRIE